MGNTIRPEKIVIPQDFDAAVASRRGEGGLDALFREPVGQETQFSIIEAKTETTPVDPEVGRTDPRGTVGKLDTVKAGERQLSDQWNLDRIDTFGLSATEAKAV